MQILGAVLALSALLFIAFRPVWRGDIAADPSCLDD